MGLRGHNLGVGWGVVSKTVKYMLEKPIFKEGISSIS